MGKFDTHGGYFAPQGYLRVDTGGSHEENPNGGVQLGVDQQGVPNMLEEGEPVYDDYVYSDNIEADENILKSHGIPVKYAGKLYSKIADSFVDEAEERPNDPISNNGLNAMLVRLADAQEEQKQIQQRKELEEDLANMSPEELAELEALLGQEEQVPVEEVDPNAVENIPISEEAPVEAVQPEMGIPQPMPAMAFGGYLRSFDDGGYKDGYREAYLKKGEQLQDSVQKIGKLYDSYKDSKIYGLLNGPDEIVLPDGTVTTVEGGTPPMVNAFAIPAKVTQAAKTATGAVKTAAKAVGNTAKNVGTITKVVATKPLTRPTAEWALLGTEGVKLIGDTRGWWDGSIKGARKSAELEYPEDYPDTTFKYLERYFDDNTKAFGGYLNNRYAWGGLTYPRLDYRTGAMFDPKTGGWEGFLGLPELRLGNVAVSDTLNNPSAAYYNLNPPKGKYYDAITGRDGSIKLGDALVTAKGKKLPTFYDFQATSQLPAVGLSKHSSAPVNSVTTTDDVDLANDVVVSHGGVKPLATFSRYAGPLMAGIAGIYNAFQKPDHYAINQSQNPIYARGRIDLVNPSFNPLDQNQAVNDVLASGAGTIRALSNSGLGPSAPAAIIAADNNIGRNVGNARTTIWDANNQRRNQVLSMINNNAATKAQFDYGVDRTNAAWANEARNRSIMNDLYVQRLNNQAESEKYAALQRQYDAIAEALSAIGRENVTLNQINSNTALPWNVGHNGWAYYAPSGANTLLRDEDGNEYVMNNDGSLKRV